MLQSGMFPKKVSVSCQHRTYASLKGRSICVPHVWSRQATSIINPDSFARWFKSPTVNFLDTVTNTLSPALPRSENICYQIFLILWNVCRLKTNEILNLEHLVPVYNYIPTSPTMGFSKNLENHSFIQMGTWSESIQVWPKVGPFVFTWCELGVGGAWGQLETWGIVQLGASVHWCQLRGPMIPDPRSKLHDPIKQAHCASHSLWNGLLRPPCHSMLLWAVPDPSTCLNHSPTKTVMKISEILEIPTDVYIIENM